MASRRRIKIKDKKRPARYVRTRKGTLVKDGKQKYYINAKSTSGNIDIIIDTLTRDRYKNSKARRSDRGIFSSRYRSRRSKIFKPGGDQGVIPVTIVQPPQPPQPPNPMKLIGDSIEGRKLATLETQVGEINQRLYKLVDAPKLNQIEANLEYIKPSFMDRVKNVFTSKGDRDKQKERLTSPRPDNVESPKVEELQSPRRSLQHELANIDEDPPVLENKDADQKQLAPTDLRIEEMNEIEEIKWNQGRFKPISTTLVMDLDTGGRVSINFDNIKSLEKTLGSTVSKAVEKARKNDRRFFFKDPELLRMLNMTGAVTKKIGNAKVTAAYIGPPNAAGSGKKDDDEGDKAEGDKAESKTKKDPTNPPNGLYDDEINSYMCKYTHFAGTIMRDELKKVLQRALDEQWDKFALVINTKTSRQEGEHWTALFVDTLFTKQICFFDPFGEEPHESIQQDLKWYVDQLGLPYLLKYKVNSNVLQADNSNRCGYHCMKFLEDMLEGKPFAKATGFQDVISKHDYEQDTKKKIKSKYNRAGFGYI